jgi:hypothetical protein
LTDERWEKEKNKTREKKRQDDNHSAEKESRATHPPLLPLLARNRREAQNVPSSYINKKRIPYKNIA